MAGRHNTDYKSFPEGQLSHWLRTIPQVKKKIQFLPSEKVVGENKFNNINDFHILIKIFLNLKIIMYIVCR